MVFRLGSKSVGFLKSAAQVLPLGVVFPKYLAGIYFLFQYGPLMFSSYLVETISLVVRLLRTIEMQPLRWTSTADIATGIYYMMAENRGKRVSTKPSGAKIDLALLAKYCALAVHVGYESSASDARRLLKLQGFELVLAETVYEGKFRDFGHNFFLATNSKEAVLVLPGTRNWADFASDVNAFATKLGEYEVHEGVCRKAKNLFLEIGPVLKHFQAKGFTVRIVGHSLGAAIGAILTVLLNSSNNGIVCYGFGSPPCVDGFLAKFAEPMVTNVVLADDIVCRATVANVHKLVQKLTEKEFVTKVRKYVVRDAKNILNFRNLMAKKSRAPLQIVSPKQPSWWESVAEQLLQTKDRLFASKSSSNIMLETDLSSKKFLIPGRIVYIPKRGSPDWASALFIDSSFELQPDMFRDHLGENYLAALRSTPTPFKERTVSSCECCGSDFLWHSVLKGEPHVFLAQHNCAQCDRIVCGPCTQKRPRQCDACRARL